MHVAAFPYCIHATALFSCALYCIWLELKVNPVAKVCNLSHLLHGPVVHCAAFICCSFRTAQLFNRLLMKIFVQQDCSFKACNFNADCCMHSVCFRQLSAVPALVVVLQDKLVVEQVLCDKLCIKLAQQL